MARILLVDCFDSFTYNIFHYLDELHPGNCDVVRYDALQLDRARSYSHIVLSPGPGIPTEYPALSQLINQAGNNQSVFGVCLGLQYLVVHFGGKLRVLDSVKHGMPGKLSLNGPCALLNGFDGAEIAHYHSWVADHDSFPEHALRITSNDSAGNIMSVEHRSRPIAAVQFHPESVLTPGGKRIFENWLAD